MYSRPAEPSWRLSTRVALSGAVAAALAGMLASVVGGATAGLWINRAEHVALLRIAYELADEIVEELEEDPDDDDAEDRAHFANTHGERTVSNLLVHELESFELPSPRAAVWDGDVLIGGLPDLLPLAVGTCVDDSMATTGGRRRCAVPMEGGQVLVLSISRAMEPARTPLFLWAMLLGTVSGALLGGVASFLAARWALRPIDDLRNRLEGIRASAPDAAVLEPPIAERELEELRSALVDLVQRLGDALATARSFAADAAHELRTPLTTLSAEIDLLGQNDVPKASADALRRRVDDLIALVQRLLALATPLEALDQCGLAIDLQDVVEEVLAKRPDADRLRVDCAPDVVVRGDEHLVEIMIANAVDNALKFSSDPVTLQVARVGDRARIDVLDRGAGIDADEAERVFEPFVRTAGARASGTPGHGVGLALIRRVAQLHGGTATLSHADGQTRLRMELSLWGPSTSTPGRGGLSKLGAGVVAITLVAALGCAGPTNVASPPPVEDAAAKTVEPTTSGILAGICEASTVVEAEGGFIVGDNEAEERLFRYDQDLQLLGEIELPVRVEDIEAFADSPEGLWVVGSSSRSKKGEARPDRRVILDLENKNAMLPDLSGCDVCMAAEQKAPKKGGISIEGAAFWESALWLGLRSPLDEQRGLLLKMREGTPKTLVVDEMVRLDLGGRGVRELRVRDGVLWVLAGPVGGGGVHALYRLDRPDGVLEKVDVEIPSGTEGFAWTPDGQLLVVLDGDGKPGKRCKEPATWARIELGADGGQRR